MSMQAEGDMQALPGKIEPSNLPPKQASNFHISSS
jgi:hypothetical protein